MGLQKEEWDFRSVDCPVCRVSLPHGLLQHMLSPKELGTGHPEPALHASLRKQGGPGVVTLPDDEDVEIDDNLLDIIERLQEQRMRVAREQERCAGLVQKGRV